MAMTNEASQTPLIDDHGQLAPPNVRRLHDNILDSLHKHYPKWDGLWHIVIDVRGGIVSIRNHALSGRMGFILHIAQIDPEGRTVMKAAGELFERYNVTRQKAIDLRDAIRSINRTPIGEAIQDG